MGQRKPPAYPGVNFSSPFFTKKGAKKFQKTFLFWDTRRAGIHPRRGILCQPPKRPAGSRPRPTTTRLDVGAAYRPPGSVADTAPLPGPGIPGPYDPTKGSRLRRGLCRAALYIRFGISLPTFFVKKVGITQLLMSLRCAAKTYAKIHASGRSRGRMDKLCKFSTSWPSFWARW